MDEIFDNKIARIDSEMTSIYSKEDVIKIITELQSNTNYYLIKNIQQPVKVSIITAEAFDKFASEVDSRLSKSINDSNDLVDYSSAEFSIEYDNRICLDSIEVMTDTITEFVNDILLDEFEKHFGKVQE